MSKAAIPGVVAIINEMVTSLELELSNLRKEEDEIIEERDAMLDVIVNRQRDVHTKIKRFGIAANVLSDLRDSIGE